MSNTTGRTGFRVTHTKAVGERRAIVHEMMRELDPKAVEYWARENTNIVVDDEAHNRGYVNDGTGRFVRATSMQEVIDYGQSRVDRLSSPLREDKPDKNGKMRGGTVTTSMFVAHLPKSLCEEVPDFYGKGRSRWVARDQDEAQRYFTDVVRFLGKNVIPGGFKAILGFDIQYSETTPHIQLLADTFADDPKHEGSLRSEWSRAYSAHRSMRDDEGKVLTGQAKMSKYQDDLKEFMVGRGWPVEREVDPLRHDKTETKATYGALKDERREFEERVEQVRGDFEQLAEEALANEHKRLNEGFAEVRLARKEVGQERKAAREEGYEQGLAEGRAEAERLTESAREQLTLARTLASQAASQDEELTVTQARATYRMASGIFADYLTKQGRIRPDLVRNAKEVVDRQAAGEGFPKVLDEIKQRAAAKARQRQRLRETIETTTHDLNDSYEF